MHLEDCYTCALVYTCKKQEQMLIECEHLDVKKVKYV